MNFTSYYGEQELNQGMGWREHKRIESELIVNSHSQKRLNTETLIFTCHTIKKIEFFINLALISN